MAARSYTAFLSYASADRKIGGWLHRKLEAYRVPRKLRKDAPGLPRRLRPIFRDREELSGGGNLNDKLIAALDASAYLVVLCSPRSAASPWVNAEIAHFKATGRSEKIIPVLAGGAPAEAFPPALTHQVTPDGAVTDIPEDAPLGADLREAGDGKRGAVLKVASGLLGVGFDTLRRREEEAQRRRTFGLVGALAGAVALIVATGAALYVALDRNARMQAAFISIIESVAEDMEVTIADLERGRLTTAEAGARLDRTRGLIETAFALAPDDPRLLEEEAAMQLVFARHYRATGQGEASLAAANRANAIYNRLGDGNDARLRLRSASLNEQGDSLLDRGETASALAAYEEALEIARDLVARDPGNLGYRRDVWVSLERIADVQLRGGDASAALAAYEEGLEIARDLVARDPGNLGYRRDVSVSLDRIADVQLRSGDAASALAAYEKGLEIRRDLAARDPGNLGYRRDVSVSLNRIADVQLRGGDASAALAAYEEGLEIARDLVALDPGNLGYRRDVSVSLNRIADVQLRGGDAASALAAYEEGLEIARDLAALDPGNLGYRRDVSLSLDRIADVQLRSGDASSVLAAYEEGLEIARDLGARDPDNLEFRAYVAVSLTRLGQVANARGDAPAACRWFNQANRAFLAAVDLEPTHAENRRMASVVANLRDAACAAP
ncbi:MAG: TIR domain-containing protein [Pseudomonadota bacterium]